MCALLVGLSGVRVVGVGDWPRWLRITIETNGWEAELRGVRDVGARSWPPRGDAGGSPGVRSPDEAGVVQAAVAVLIVWPVVDRDRRDDRVVTVCADRAGLAGGRRCRSAGTVAASLTSRSSWAVTGTR